MFNSMENTKAAGSAESKKSILDSTFPVLLPELPLLAEDEFQVYIRKLLSSRKAPRNTDREVQVDALTKEAHASGDATAESVTDPDMATSISVIGTTVIAMDAKPINAGSEKAPEISMEDKMQTENADLAYKDTKPLVDLFFELETVITGLRLQELLENAWKDDADATLKIIWNSRSIHLGKASKEAFYKACGWLAQNHPQTFIANLEWLIRPVIPKTSEQAKAGEDKDTVLLTSDGEETHDVEHGGAHGYWKDLLNLLMLAAHDQLHVMGDPRSVLNVTVKTKKAQRDWDPVRGESRRREQRDAQHAKVVEKLSGSDPLYKALHLTVAKIFGQQLKRDIQALSVKSKDEEKAISLAGKWAPSSRESHDRSTFVVSSIAEALFPQSQLPGALDDDRTTYLKKAREAYRFHVISPIRKILAVVERDISAGTFGHIRYDRIPSIAMNRYQNLFMEKDPERFDQYLDQVASGQSKISGATLLPSTLVWQALASASGKGKGKGKKISLKNFANAKVVDGQWNSLVKSIRDNGKLESSIAVCDVSLSMFNPKFPDKTTPIHSSIGLALLLAEITEPPFGNSFITFTTNPDIVEVGGPEDGRTFTEKVLAMQGADWGGSTDLVAVFEKLLLPRALKLKTPPEKMVKQLFVFTDMHFDAATNENTWTSSFERIQKAYKDAGYEMPQLIFWNLAGGRAAEAAFGEAVAPKPVNAEQPGTALVNGYSASQMKMFLDGGQFDDLEEGEQEFETEEVEDEEDVAIVTAAKKQKMDPLSTVKKAISHPAYKMLKVVD